MRYILAPSSLAGRGLGVGFLYLITSGSAVKNGVEEACYAHGRGGFEKILSQGQQGSIQG